MSIRPFNPLDYFYTYLEVYHGRYENLETKILKMAQRRHEQVIWKAIHSWLNNERIHKIRTLRSKSMTRPVFRKFSDEKCNVHIFKLAKGWHRKCGLSTLDKVERDWFVMADWVQEIIRDSWLRSTRHQFCLQSRKFFIFPFDAKWLAGNESTVKRSRSKT